MVRRGAGTSSCAGGVCCPPRPPRPLLVAPPPCRPPACLPAAPSVAPRPPPPARRPSPVLSRPQARTRSSTSRTLGAVQVPVVNTTPLRCSTVPFLVFTYSRRNSFGAFLAQFATSDGTAFQALEYVEVQRVKKNPGSASQAHPVRRRRRFLGVPPLQPHRLLGRFAADPRAVRQHRGRATWSTGGGAPAASAQASPVPVEGARHRAVGFVFCSSTFPTRTRSSSSARPSRTTRRRWHFVIPGPVSSALGGVFIGSHR